MLIYCSWCQEYLGEKEPLEIKDETHTICPSCYQKNIKDKTEKDVILETLRSVDIRDKVGIDIVYGLFKYQRNMKDNREYENEWDEEDEADYRYHSIKEG
jgi:hypothetical protein